MEVIIAGMLKRLIPFAAGILLLLVLLAVVVTPVRQRAANYLASLRAEIYQYFNPPARDVFVPEAAVEAAVQATLSAMATPTAAPSPTPAETNATAEPTPWPTATLPPPPAEVQLAGTVHEYQQWNNCGPATLSVALTYWGWQGDQRNTAGWIKPNPRDKNTSPEELVNYVRSETELDALLRVGGDLGTLKQLLAAGFPVIIERGFDSYDDEGWMGHYELVTGYRDDRQLLITQDVLIMPDFPLPYAELEQYWPQFNNTLVVVFPREREAEVLRALGPLAEAEYGERLALERASAAAAAAQGRDLFFALYNAGSSLLALGQPQQAAEAFDQAFSAYPLLIEEDRPWRVVWYRHGPLDAYYQTGRYQDVISLASHTLSRTGEPALEESFLWRARARLALQDRQGAREDLLEALEWHPGWLPAVQDLDALEGS